jgi:hypothetical protein
MAVRKSLGLGGSDSNLTFAGRPYLAAVVQLEDCEKFLVSQKA